MTPTPLSTPAALVSEGELPTTSEGRLLNARRLIEDEAISVVSLDVFDTLLWRTVPRPTDAFVLLGDDLAGAGILADGISPEAFRRLRITAEARARAARTERNDGTEVTLDEIWAQFPGHVLRYTPPAVCVEHEVRLEERITYPDLDIAAFAQFAAKHHCRLVLVSNTYLSAQQLVRLISRPQTEVLRSARVFPSSAFGVHKADGLWKIVLDELGVAPDRILHVGDELESDVEEPSELGIHTVHYRRVSPETALVLDREGTLPRVEKAPRRHAVDKHHGDFGFTALRAKVGGRVEAVHLPADQAVAWHYGATVLGPALTGFAAWVHRRAEGLGVPSVWCMMREGEFLADLVRRESDSRGSGIAARPVWLSRHITARATVSEATEEELALLLRRRLVPTVGEYLTSLGLGLGEVTELRQAAHERMDRYDLANTVIGTLSTNEHLRTRIIAESTAARGRLLRYLQPVLEEPGDATVLVDLGWHGTIQRQLAKALELSGVHRRLVGLYLATNEQSCDRILDGLEIHGYLANCGEPNEEISQIGRSPEILEQACLATCGSLVDFDAKGDPVLDDSVPPPEQVTSKIVVQHGARAFQREWLRYAEATGTFGHLDGTEAGYLIEVLRKSVTHPTADEARTLGAWTHDDNFGVAKREEVIPARLGAYTPYLSAPDLLEMTMHDAYWPLGLAAQYDPGLAASAQAVLAGALDTEAFEPYRWPAEIELAIDCGQGFVNGQSRPLRINRNGLTYAHFDLRGDAIRSVRFDPCNHQGIFRIDWIELALRIKDHTEPQWHRLEGAQDFGRFVYAGCHWLYDGVAISTTDDPQVHIDLARYTRGEIYGVDFKVAMSVLTLPGTRQDLGLTGPDASRSVRHALGKVRQQATEGGVSAVAQGALRFARRSLR
jgi:FMN phosphatase YigB (HAD superfamily)